MKSIKQMLLGIALLLFGMGCCYVAVQADWAIVQAAGVLMLIFGLWFAVIGYLNGDP